MVVRRAVNSEVAGSSPAVSAKNAGLAQMVEQPPCKRKVIGSSPLSGTK